MGSNMCAVNLLWYNTAFTHYRISRRTYCTHFATFLVMPRGNIDRNHCHRRRQYPISFVTVKLRVQASGNSVIDRLYTEGAVGHT